MSCSRCLQSPYEEKPEDEQGSRCHRLSDSIRPEMRRQKLAQFGNVDVAEDLESLEPPSHGRQTDERSYSRRLPESGDWVAGFDILRPEHEKPCQERIDADGRYLRLAPHHASRR